MVYAKDLLDLVRSPFNNYMLFLSFFLFWGGGLFRAVPAAHGGYQARGLIGATAARPMP